MSMHENPPNTSRWHAEPRQAPVRLFLAGDRGDAGALLGAKVGDYPIEVELCAVTDWIDPAQVATAAAAIIQVDADSPAAIKRFERLALTSETPLIAACYEPPLALVRGLIRAGAHDVLPLPLDLDELATALDPVRRGHAEPSAPAPVQSGKLVGVIRSEGGVGATALLCQLALVHAAREAALGRRDCLMDLDVQFGDAAFQLGLHPRLGLGDLLEAGSRIDGELIRSVAATHPLGLSVIAAPRDVLPIESFPADQMMLLVDRMTREYGTLFLDLPANWTNWSLSLLARCDLVLLVTELRLASLHRTRRLLDLLREQDLGGLELKVVINQLPKRGFRHITEADVERVLGRPVSFTVSDDEELVEAAIERGVPITEIRRKSALGRDLDQLDAGVAVLLGQER